MSKLRLRRNVLSVIVGLGCLCCLLVGSGCTDPDVEGCASNDECVDGLLCDRQGSCVSGKAVSIKPVSLPDAEVGEGYKQPLQAQDGLAPYSWSMKVVAGADMLGWLMVDPQTGELKAKPGEAPGEVGRDLRIEVTVRDSSNAGEGETASRMLTLNIIECKGEKICYEDKEGVCWQGKQACVGGKLQACVLSVESTSLKECGSDCDPCPATTTDSCVGGLCSCGPGGDPCDGGKSCCSGACFDLSNTVNHCGSCDVDCEDPDRHVTHPTCKDNNGGECDYATCETGYFDCDGARQNGCEIAQSANHCGSCDNDCTDTDVYVHTKEQTCQDEDKDGVWVCGHKCLVADDEGANGKDWDDCDPDVDGCETDITTEYHCGSCNDACVVFDQDQNPLPGPNGGLCLGDGSGNRRCGCNEGNQGTDCPAVRICCDTICVEHSWLNCESCNDRCEMPTKDGPLCIGAVETGWSCQCENDPDCKGRYDFSEVICDSRKCICIGETKCDGTTESMCCRTNGTPGCVNLETNANHCGVCRRKCADGKLCGQDCGAPGGVCGACTCEATDQCPNLSGTGWNEAWQCVNGLCVCPQHANQPCPPGQYCCGETGPDQPNGCCMMDCSTLTNEGNSCNSDCGGVWCYWGCCSTCADESECEANEPAGFPFDLIR